MNEKINLIGIKDITLIKTGDNLSSIIFNALTHNNISLENGDILVVAQTIVSKSLGRFKNLANIKPSQEAIEIYNNMAPLAKRSGLPIKSPELIQVILDESKEVLKAEHVMLVETYHGFICANAGIDQSNVGSKDFVTLLPLDSDEEAEKIRDSLQKLTGKKLAIIISDSFGRAFRIGAVGVALGVAGINPILDKRGNKDLYGKELQSTIIGQIDNLASSAQLIMGEADEGLPVVIIRGYDFKFDENASIKQILRKKELDLFREESVPKSFEKILRSRRSYKYEFKDRKVERTLIKESIELARWAPSAHNGQFWRYIIMEQGKKREILIENMNSKLKDDLHRDGRSEEFILRKIEKTKTNFLKSPYLILLCLDIKELEKYSDTLRERNEYIMGVQSVSTSATYLLLAFEIKGLAACWYCAPLFAKEIIKDTLNLPDSFVPMAFFTVGYALKESPKTNRKDLKDIIFRV
ncbi:MAG: coenzyme F420-0:L-glutamate ligase [Candidatus Lokiarchaeota archaeon]|nr:coenzyme F420-0:L-glutamate ligase [Candidatus Lokiarchaeota archaeon]